LTLDDTSGQIVQKYHQAYEIPYTSSGIYNTKSPRFTLVQVAPQNFIPTWDEVNFQKAPELSCG